MAKNKTVETENSVMEYLSSITNEKRRTDCSVLIELITKQTGFTPKMWGTGIVGFGSYHYRYESGHEGDAPLTGIASRSNAITVYLATDFNQKEGFLKKLGKYKTGKGCLYIQKLEDIDAGVLIEMIQNSIGYIKNKYPA